MDKDFDSKFDIQKEFIPNKHNNPTAGSKLRTLRLKNNLTLKQLAEQLNISEPTLRKIELNKISKPYYYWMLICDYFSINHIKYLELLTYPEETIQEKLWKIRILLGARTWKEVGTYLAYSEGFVLDLLTRYIPNSYHINTINTALNKLKTYSKT